MTPVGLKRFPLILLIISSDHLIHFWSIISEERFAGSFHRSYSLTVESNESTSTWKPKRSRSAQLLGRLSLLVRARLALSLTTDSRGGKDIHLPLCRHPGPCGGPRQSCPGPSASPSLRTVNHRPRLHSVFLLLYPRRELISIFSWYLCLTDIL